MPPDDDMRHWLAQLPLSFMHRLGAETRSIMRRRLSSRPVARRLAFEVAPGGSGDSLLIVRSPVDLERADAAARDRPMTPERRALDDSFPLYIEAPIYEQAPPMLNQYLRTTNTLGSARLLDLLEPVPQPTLTSSIILTRLRDHAPWLYDALRRSEHSEHFLGAIERAADEDRLNVWLDEVRSSELRLRHAQTPADRVNDLAARWRRHDDAVFDFYVATFYVALLLDYYAHMQFAATDRLELYASLATGTPSRQHVFEFLKTEADTRSLSSDTSTIENWSALSPPPPRRQQPPPPVSAQQRLFDQRWALESTHLLRALYDWAQRRDVVTTARTLFERARSLERVRARLVDSEARRLAEAAVTAVRCTLAP